ncbi:MAG: GxxExxY protein [Opitutales bacterium]|nr:GxxExxY protein [Opitutales bacterium]
MKLFTKKRWHSALIWQKSRLVKQHELKIRLWGRELKKTYYADFLVFDQIIVEIKAQKALSSADESQLLNYMKASGKQIGLLINFGAPSLEFKRFVR